MRVSSSGDSWIDASDPESVHMETGFTEDVSPKCVLVYRGGFFRIDLPQPPKHDGHPFIEVAGSVPASNRGAWHGYWHSPRNARSAPQLSEPQSQHRTKERISCVDIGETVKADTSISERGQEDLAGHCESEVHFPA
jgi:hypothetical protein